jgi:squalene-associated FAD-dependent desaturase
LAAALDLTQNGAHVELFERTRLLGGRATSFVVDGCEVDNGQHVFLGCCDAFIDFVQRVGMGDALYLQKRFDVLVLRNGVRARLRAASLPAPWHLAASFLTYRHLSAGARFAVIRALLNVRSAAKSDASFAAWLAGQRQPSEALRAFWEPFVVPALNAPLARISASDAAFVLETAFLSGAAAARFGWCTVPLAHVAAAAAQRVAGVHLSATVAGIETRDDGVTLAMLGGARSNFDAVVVAVPPPQLARILGESSQYGLSDLDGYEPYPIVDVHLWHGEADVDFTFAALVDSPVQWIFRKGDGYLCCSASAAGDMLTAPTEAVVARCWDEVRRAVPALSGVPLQRSAVTRNPTATYLPRPGAVRPGAATRVPRVVIAGSWTATGWPDTMESAVRSGRAAARALGTTPPSAG